MKNPIKQDLATLNSDNIGSSTSVGIKYKKAYVNFTNDGVTSIKNMDGTPFIFLDKSVVLKIFSDGYDFQPWAGGNYYLNIWSICK